MLTEGFKDLYLGVDVLLLLLVARVGDDFNSQWLLALRTFIGLLDCAEVAFAELLVA